MQGKLSLMMLKEVWLLSSKQSVDMNLHLSRKVSSLMWRSLRIQGRASIVALVLRIVNTKSSVPHPNSIVAEVTNQLQSLFLQNPIVIRKQIESLFEQNKNDWKLYRYLAWRNCVIVTFWQGIWYWLVWLFLLVVYLEYCFWITLGLDKFNLNEYHFVYLCCVKSRSTSKNYRTLARSENKESEWKFL